MTMALWRAVPRGAIAGTILAAFAAGTIPAPAAAQDEARLRKIEAELKAVQRVVFPNGDGRFFTPEITPEATVQQQPGTPSSSVLTDVLARLDALETQLARLTARIEVTGNTVELMEERLSLIEAERAAAAPAPPIADEGPTGVIVPPGETRELPASADAQGAAAGPAAAPSAAAAGPSPERVAAVRAILKPATEDAGDDEYVYGFRLWDAGFYSEAQQQLASFLEQYPDHWRTTYGRNLLGRAFLDAGAPREAATHFFANYQADKQAARAPDSLLFLAESMIALGDSNRACIALAEFGDTYPALATGRLQDQYDADRAKVTCG